MPEDGLSATRLTHGYGSRGLQQSGTWLQLLVVPFDHSVPDFREEKQNTEHAIFRLEN